MPRLWLHVWSQQNLHAHTTYNTFPFQFNFIACFNIEFGINVKSELLCEMVGKKTQRFLLLSFFFPLQYFCLSSAVWPKIIVQACEHEHKISWRSSVFYLCQKIYAEYSEPSEVSNTVCTMSVCVEWMLYKGINEKLRSISRCTFFKQEEDITQPWKVVGADLETSNSPDNQES